MPQLSALEKLREKEAALKAEIKDAQKAATAEKREIDKQRAAIIGIALAAEMQENQELAKQLEYCAASQRYVIAIYWDCQHSRNDERRKISPS